MVRLTSAQKGATAVLLVQWQLLQMGIDSAPMTTDYKIDLVAYYGRQKKSFTIQVKSRKPEKDGEFSWRIANSRRVGPADVFALVSGGSVW